MTLDPHLALTLFVAPVLVDAAYDTCLRDLRANWRPVAGLVVAAVGTTVLAVALAVRWLVPDIPWPAAIALGAIVAPPDAAVFGSFVAGMGCAFMLRPLTSGLHEVPISVIVQFACTFGVWIAAEAIGLSGILTMIVFAMTMARRGGTQLPAACRQRDWRRSLSGAGTGTGLGGTERRWWRAARMRNPSHRARSRGHRLAFFHKFQ